LAAKVRNAAIKQVYSDLRDVCEVEYVLSQLEVL
jgi:hypothetical protein